MKKFAKFLSVLLAVALVLSLAIVAYADGEEGPSITIENPAENETYTIYKMFDVVAQSGRNVTYKLTDSSWEAFFATGDNPGAGSEYISVSDQGYVTWIGEDTAARKEAFSQAALIYAADHVTGTSITKNEETEVVKFENLSVGYYLVDSTVGVLCALDTVTDAATITEKHDVPEITKAVEEVTVAIGDTVHYTITVTAQKGIESYTVTDIMTDGLDFAAITSVTTGEGDAAQDVSYDVVPDENGHGFVLTIADFEVEEPTFITIRYTATVNETAIDESNVQENRATLNYGQGSEVEAEPVVVFTCNIPVFKYTPDDTVESGKAPLAGAKFALYEGDTLLKFTGSNGAYVLSVSEGDDGVDIVSPADGNITLKGLCAGEYTLVETEAPAGFNKAEDIVITVDDEGKVNGVEGTIIEVENQAGSLLPSTGGIGTTIFYIAGAVLVLGAGIVLIVRKRMSLSK